MQQTQTRQKDPDQRYLSEGMVRAAIIPNDSLSLPELYGIEGLTQTLRERGYTNFRILPLDVAFAGQPEILDKLYRQGTIPKRAHIVYAKTIHREGAEERGSEALVRQLLE